MRCASFEATGYCPAFGRCSVCPPDRAISRKAMTLSVLYGEDGPSALQAARCNAEPRDPRDRDGQKR